MTSPKPFKNWRVDRVLEALGDHVNQKVGTDRVPERALESISILTRRNSWKQNRNHVSGA
jgi:hypothetical protein